MAIGFYVCLFVFSIGLLYFCIRNDWVYAKRKKLNRFENDVHIIKEYMNYNEMMARFWIWDVEKLRKRKTC